MQKRINNLIVRFQQLYDGEPWYGESQATILEGITADIAVDKPLPECHSILEILSHMVAWKEFVLKKVKGEEFDLKTFNANDWREVSRSNWNDIIMRLNQGYRSLIDVLQEKTDGFLDQQVPGNEFNFKYLLEGSMQHDIYHLGQVALLKKHLIKGKRVFDL